MSKYLSTTERRQARVRRAVKAGAKGRPRLSVFRSSKHIYAQIIDDLKGGTVVAASSIEKTVRDGGKTGANVDAAKAVGSSWPSVRSRRASPKWCSIAAAISTTAASRRSAMPRVKLDSSFKDQDRWHVNRANEIAAPASGMSRASSSTSSSTSIVWRRW